MTTDTQCASICLIHFDSVDRRFTIVQIYVISFADVLRWVGLIGRWLNFIYHAKILMTSPVFLGGGYKLQIFSYKILMIHLKNMHDYLTETIQIFIRCNQHQISKCFTFIILLLCLSSHNYNCMWTLNDCVKLCCVMLVWSQSRDGIRIQWFSTLLTYYW